MEHFYFSSPVVSQLLVRSVNSDRPDEVRFRFGKTICRFGRRKFALITGLSFREVESNVGSVEKRCSSLVHSANRDQGAFDIKKTPFNIDPGRITIDLIEQALKNTTDDDVVYKLGLIYLIEAVLLGKTSETHVSTFVFFLVDDIPRFLSYSWGSYLWDITLKKIKEKRDGLQCHSERGRKLTTDMCCFVYAIFVWLYETTPSIGRIIGRHIANKVPRMLSWHPISGRIQNKMLSSNLEFNGLDVIRYLKPTEVEREMLRRNGFTDDEIETPTPVYPVPHDAPPICGNYSSNSHVRGDTSLLECAWPEPCFKRNVSDGQGNASSTNKNEAYNALSSNTNDEIIVKLQNFQQQFKKDTTRQVDNSRNEIITETKDVSRLIGDVRSEMSLNHSKVKACLMEHLNRQKVTESAADKKQKQKELHQHGSMATKEISLKLMIDTESNKVLFAEASKDFVDFLIFLLSLPIATAIKLLTNESMAGSIGNIYTSVSNLDETYFRQDVNKDYILNPMVFSSLTNIPMSARIRSSIDSSLKLYTCSDPKCKQGITDFINGVRCPGCLGYMNREIEFIDIDSYGYVHDVASYMISDDLTVTPISTMSIVSKLSKFNVSKLEERNVKIGIKEALEVL